MSRQALRELASRQVRIDEVIKSYEGGSLRTA